MCDFACSFAATSIVWEFRTAQLMRNVGHGRGAASARLLQDRDELDTWRAAHRRFAQRDSAVSSSAVRQFRASVACMLLGNPPGGFVKGLEGRYPDHNGQGELMPGESIHAESSAKLSDHPGQPRDKPTSEHIHTIRWGPKELHNESVVLWLALSFASIQCNC